MTKKEEFLQRIKKIEKSDFEKVVSKKMTLEEMAKLYNMDVKTLKQKIEDLASNDIEWNKLFSEYYGKRNDYNGYDFKSEMIQMLEEDMSQTQMAKKIGIPRETLTKKINQLSDNDELKQELKKHSTRKKNHRKLSSEEKLKQMIFVNEYREKNNIEKSREYEATKGSKVEQRLFYLNQILNLYNDVKENYPDLNEKQISEQLDFDPSTIRRYKREKELLTSLREKDMEK
jgi:predicted transcriptional regulator